MWNLKKKRRSKGFTAQIVELRGRLNNGVALAEKDLRLGDEGYGN